MAEASSKLRVPMPVRTEQIRFLAHVPVGPMPHAAVMRVIELLGGEVAPAVRREVGIPENQGQAPSSKAGRLD